MDSEERLKLRRLVAAWSDGPGLAQATALADQYRHLLPRRITYAQLSGLNGIVQAADNLGDVIAFTQHQGERAMRAGRQDVRGYWDALRQALEAVEGEAVDLAAKGGMALAPPSGKGKARPKAPEWLTLRLVKEFIQHFVFHSLYLGQKK